MCLGDARPREGRVRGVILMAVNVCAAALQGGRRAAAWEVGSWCRLGRRMAEASRQRGSEEQQDRREARRAF